ncbi:redoxin domain-containing protein [Marinoscillum sp.]|uniref:redoxin domain-containing protein n=1 Tax=Marinoscillum sp. TaxID=2024838 RepID=UPI003BAAC8A9
MKLIRNTISVLVIALLGVSCTESSNDKGVQVTGKVENPIDGELVVLNEFTPEGLKPIDTIDVEKSGEFRFKVPVEYPSFFRLNFYNRQQLNLVLDGKEKEVEIMLEGDNPQGEVSIAGSRHTNYVKQLEGMMRDQQSDIQDLQQQAMEARTNSDQAAMERITEEYYDLMTVAQSDMKEYLWSITPSLAVIYGLESLPIDEHYTFYDSIAQKMQTDSALAQNFFVEDLIGKVQGAKKLAIGADAPEISLPNPDGEVITLSSLKGKYVLIDFWAAWCKPCRAENPNVVRVYNEYAGENFEILGVSLDRNKKDWVKAIEQDGLPWKHVSDLQYFNSEAAQTYQISAIPATYLIGPDGKILAKGLRGPSLEAKLKEIFG